MKNLVFILSILAIAACQNPKKEIITTESPEKSTIQEVESSFKITPIEHATAVFTWDEVVFYIDPVGGKSAFDGQPAPDIILLTDIHGDHWSQETLDSIQTENAVIIAPQAVLDLMNDKTKSQTKLLANDDSTTLSNFEITAIPMYNLREEALQYHEKGRGNGYLIEKDDMRVYFSGDTEDIPEMRSLTNIDKAFVCMNLPYTMTVETAADAVLAFAPKEVYPYHFRGQDGKSDVNKFKELVNQENNSVKVEILNWYPNEE